MTFTLCRSWVWLLSLLVLCSCSPKLPSYLKTARRAEAEARRAFEHHDPEGADLAASRAEVALADLQFALDSRKLTEPGLLRDTRAAALSARNYAQLSHEEYLRLKKLDSLKLKAYQRIRATVCGYGLAGLAPAADQLAQFGTNSSSAAEQQVAGLARSLVEFVNGKLASSNGPPDWRSIAANLRAWSTNPPPELGMALALGFSASGFNDFALSEIESVTPSKMTATNLLSFYHLERGALFAFHGWDRSAARELDQAIVLSPNGWNSVGTTQALALFHFWLADHALQRGHHAQADAELELAEKAWPNSPLLGFFLAEKFALNGEWQRASGLLEEQAAVAKDPWLVDRLNQRARELRQSRGLAPPLFSDARFVFEFVSRAVAEHLIESAAREKVQQWLTNAQSFGERLAEKLPGTGSAR